MHYHVLRIYWWIPISWNSIFLWRPFHGMELSWWKSIQGTKLSGWMLFYKTVTSILDWYCFMKLTFIIFGWIRIHRILTSTWIPFQWVITFSLVDTISTISGRHFLQDMVSFHEIVILDFIAWDGIFWIVGGCYLIKRDYWVENI